MTFYWVDPRLRERRSRPAPAPEAPEEIARLALTFTLGLAVLAAVLHALVLTIDASFAGPALVVTWIALLLSMIAVTIAGGRWLLRTGQPGAVLWIGGVVGIAVGAFRLDLRVLIASLGALAAGSAKLRSAKATTPRRGYYIGCILPGLLLLGFLLLMVLAMAFVQVFNDVGNGH